MWQLTPGQAFRFRQYDDEFVLYNDLSCSTHLLTDTAMHVLSTLQQGALSGDALAASLAAALECPRDAAFEAQAAGVIAQLAKLSLICRA
jgi:PqqD family protein of HPr-rel-A system